jgi:hypothetical protein
MRTYPNFPSKFITKCRLAFVTRHCCPLLSLYDDSKYFVYAGSTAGTQFLESSVGRSEIVP